MTASSVFRAGKRLAPLLEQADRGSRADVQGLNGGHVVGDADLEPGGGKQSGIHALALVPEDPGAPGRQRAFVQVLRAVQGGRYQRHA